MRSLSLRTLVVDERADLLAFLRTLNGDEWNAPSLCEGWRIRDVVSHLLYASVPVHQYLIDEVWGTDYVGDTKTLDVHVKRLREKIETDPRRPECITTVRGLGYRFTAEDS